MSDEFLSFVNRERLEDDALTFLRLLPLVDLVDVKIVDWATAANGEINKVEVERAGQRTWMEPAEAAGLIAERIAGFIAMRIRGGNND